MDEYPRGNHYPFNAVTEQWLEYRHTETNTHSTCSSGPWPLAYICTLEISVQCFRRCIAQFRDMSEYTNQVHGSKQRTVVWKLVSRNTNRPPTPKKLIFEYNFVPDVICHYSLSLNWYCCESSVPSGRVQRKCSGYFTQFMYVDRTGAPRKGLLWDGAAGTPPSSSFFFFLLYLRKWGTCHWLVLVPDVLYSQGSDHIWCFSCVYT